MGNIGKREKIILGIMALAVLYGLFILITGMTNKKKTGISPAAKTKEIESLAADATNAAGKDTLSAAETYAIARIESEWLHDPFYEKKAYNEMLRSAKAGKVEVKVTFTYTGYMEYAGRQIAIINGNEYGAGEALDAPGYVLRSISPTKVTIGNKADKSTKIEVEIQDL